MVVYVVVLLVPYESRLDSTSGQSIVGYGLVVSMPLSGIITNQHRIDLEMESKQHTENTESGLYHRKGVG